MSPYKDQNTKRFAYSLTLEQPSSIKGLSVNLLKFHFDNLKAFNGPNGIIYPYQLHRGIQSNQIKVVQSSSKQLEVVRLSAFCLD